MSRAQVAVYAAIGIVLVLLGIRALRAPTAGDEGGGAGGSGGGVQLSNAPVGSKSGPAPSDGDVVVHVTGAVQKPGVYRLPAGSRVTDAVERAGGGASKADPNAINLAARVADGQQVVVPERVASGASAVAPAPGTDPATEGPISLGSADSAALETIDGIGPSTAAAILEYRDEHGGISSIDELDEVPGIGPATIAALSDRLQP